MKVLKFLGIYPTHIGATQPWRFYFSLRGSSSNNKKVLKTQRKKHKKCRNNFQREKRKKKEYSSEWKWTCEMKIGLLFLILSARAEDRKINAGMWFHIDRFNSGTRNRHKLWVIIFYTDEFLNIRILEAIQLIKPNQIPWEYDFQSLTPILKLVVSLKIPEFNLHITDSIWAFIWAVMGKSLNYPRE